MLNTSHFIKNRCRTIEIVMIKHLSDRVYFCLAIHFTGFSINQISKKKKFKNTESLNNVMNVEDVRN